MLTGEIITPCSPKYHQARREWNRRIDRYPRAIIYCSTEEDVRDAVRRAVKDHLKLRVRGGGHNYEGYSVADGALVIDTSRMNHAEVDTSEETLTIQGGVQNQLVYRTAAAYGRPFPGGTCRTVGVIGYALGGGWGLSCRYLGLGCDSLKSYTMVDYRGDVLRVNKSTDPDLLWASQGGGGGNFGIVTQATFCLARPVGNITYVELSYSDTWEAKMVRFLDKWQKMLPGLDRRLTLLASLFSSATTGRGIFVRGFFYGPPSDAEELMRPLANLGGGTLTLESLPFIEAVARVEEDDPAPERFKSTGRFVHKLYNSQQLERIVGLIAPRPPYSDYVGLSLYCLGGAVSDRKPRDSAFWYRNARYILGLQSVWEDASADNINIEWVNRRFPVLEKLTQGSFVNFPFNGLSDYMHAYYGGNASDLIQIKKRVDPCDVFHFRQSIR